MTRSLSVVAAAAVLLGALPAFAASPPPKPKPAAKAAAKTVTLPDGLTYTDVFVGKGPMPKPGQTAVVSYVGTFPDGKVFDSTAAGQTFTFHVGAHDVIRCWDEGVATMHVGGKRKLVCPPDLAYGAKGASNVIPPNATLDFEVTLLKVE
jgi:peptidylprolyl isomerase